MEKYTKKTVIKYAVILLPHAFWGFCFFMLNQSFSYLNKRSWDLEREINDLKHDAKMEALEKDLGRVGMFHPSSKGFSQINSDLGTFFVSLEDIQPYANGYKAKFQIGNPQAAAYLENTRVEISWGPEFSAGRELSEWESSLRTTEIEVGRRLEAGTWNDLTLTLAPAKAEEISFLRMRIIPKGISLKH